MQCQVNHAQMKGFRGLRVHVRAAGATKMPMKVSKNLLWKVVAI